MKLYARRIFTTSWEQLCERDLPPGMPPAMPPVLPSPAAMPPGTVPGTAAAMPPDDRAPSFEFDITTSAHSATDMIWDAFLCEFEMSSSVARATPFKFNLVLTMCISVLSAIIGFLLAMPPSTHTAWMVFTHKSCVDDMSVLELGKHLPWTMLILALSILVLIGRIICLTEQYWRDCAFKQSHHDADLEETLESSSSSMISWVSAEASLSNIVDAASGLSGFRFTAGKHSGRTFRKVYDIDKQYVKWCTDHGSPNKLSSGFQTFILYAHLGSKMS